MVNFFLINNFSQFASISALQLLLEKRAALFFKGEPFLNNFFLKTTERISPFVGRGEVEFEWRFYAESASEAIGTNPLSNPGDNPLLFSICDTGSFICPVAQTWLDIPRSLTKGTGAKSEVFSSASETRTDNASAHSPTC